MLERDEVVARWADGLANGMAGLETLLSPTARIWHSTDGEWLSREDARRRMDDSPPGASGFRDVRHQATGAGGVIQARLDRGDGAVHIVQVLTIEGGVIVALEEYIAPTTGSS